MSQINSSEHVCNIVTENPNRAKIFDKYRIEYCCGGKIPLDELCKKKNINLEKLITELQEVDAILEETVESFNLEKSSLGELVDNIESKHHRYLEEELPAIEKLLKKVVARHGTEHPEFKELQDLFNTFNIDLLEHMRKEESILFPWIRRLESEKHNAELLCDDIKNPIAIMMHEHDDAGEFLEKFRNLTNGYIPFEGACPTVRVLLQKFNNLESDMHKHVHKENHVLFPKAIAKAGGL